MKIRKATSSGVTAITAMPEKLVAAVRRYMPADIKYLRQYYVDNPLGIRCRAAEDESGDPLGFQSSVRAIDGTPDMPVGWGIISAHVLTNNEVSIGRGNVVAQAYYERMGFQTYRVTDAAVCGTWTRTESQVVRAFVRLLIRSRMGIEPATG